MKDFPPEALHALELMRKYGVDELRIEMGHTPRVASDAAADSDYAEIMLRFRVDLPKEAKK